MYCTMGALHKTKNRANSVVALKMVLQFTYLEVISFFRAGFLYLSQESNFLISKNDILPIPHPTICLQCCRIKSIPIIKCQLVRKENLIVIAPLLNLRTYQIYNVQHT